MSPAAGLCWLEPALPVSPRLALGSFREVMIAMLRSGQFPMAPVPVQWSHRAFHVEILITVRGCIAQDAKIMHATAFLAPVAHYPIHVKVMTQGRKAITWMATCSMNALGGAQNRGHTHTNDMGRRDMGFTWDKGP
eukprot:1372946-Amphidinium_carterae.1